MEQNNVNRMDARGDEPGMHELLCKVVFGEANAEEAAQVEAALLLSTELQAEKAELEATVSLVRGTMGAERAPTGAGEKAAGVLSADRMSAVLEAAAGPEPTSAPAVPAGQLITGTPWHRSPVLRAAAVTLLAAGGLWLAEGRDPKQRELAEADQSGKELGKAEVGRNEILGMTADVVITPVDVATAKGGFAELKRQFRDGPELAPLPSSSGIPAEEWRQYTNRKMDVGEARLPLDPNVALNMPAMGGQLSSDGKAGFEADDSSSTFFFGRPLRDVSSAPGTDPAAGQASVNNWYLESAEDAYLGVGHGGTYRGPGDTVPPGAATAGGFIGVTRPTTKPQPGGSRRKISISGAQVPIALPFGTPKARPSDPAAPGTFYGAPSASPGATTTSVPTPSLANLGLRFMTTGGGNGPASLGYIADPSSDVSEPVVLYAGRGGSHLGLSALDLKGYGQPSHRDRHRAHEPMALPGERPRDMFFRFWGDNAFVISQRDALSTFAADVDTASFALAKRTLAEGRLPHRAQIRTEEFVNFLEPDLACPTEDTFGIQAELSPSPFGGAANRYLLRVGVRAMDVAPAERPPLSLTFVVDTSGSMRENNRLELVKHALRLLVDQLDGRDTISIVRFSTDASVVLEPTPATSGDVIETALFGLQPDGSTNAEAGLKLGYDMAVRTIAEGTQTRVVFLSDGVANVGQTDQDRIASDVEAFSDRNVFLNTIGVGMGNHNDVFLEQLADKGEGVCDYVGDAADARRAIVDRFVGGFVTVARDVKIQVEFDPKVVLRWRQVGYENRAVRDQDFRNDKVDAGEIGAGHQVTCLYEVEIASGDAKADRPLATARLRWKPVTPGEAQPAEEATERELAFRYGDIAAPTFREASLGFRRSALAAQLAESLRDSIHTAGDPVETLGKELAQLLSEDRHKDTATVAEMTRQAIGLGLKTRPMPTLTGVDADHLDAYYDALIQSLGGAESQNTPKEDAGKDTETARIEPRERESRIRGLLEGNQGGKAH